MSADAGAGCSLPPDASHRAQKVQLIQQCYHKNTAKVRCQLFINHRYIIRKKKNFEHIVPGDIYNLQGTPADCIVYLLYTHAQCVAFRWYTKYF